MRNLFICKPGIVRFMESPRSLLRMHWHLEPIAFPLTRPSDTLSPTGGEGRGEGVRFMESGVSLGERTERLAWSTGR
jgi:hypothetical protein